MPISPSQPMPKVIGQGRSQLGFSLVELMVGLAIGLIVVTALLVLFANASATGQNLGRSSSQIENGRYVSELLREDVRLAGFFGEMPDPPTAPVYTNPDPCLTVPTGFVNSPFGLPAPVQGILPKDLANPGPTCLSDRKDGTAALVLRRLAVETTPVAGLAANQFYVQYSFCKTDPSATALVFSKTASDFTLKNFTCAAANPVRAYVSRVYYIANCNNCGTDTTPTLKRLDLVGNSHEITALAEGVETLRFEYGFDTNGDGITDGYLTDSNSPGSSGPTSLWQNALTLKAHFIVRSLEKVTGGAPNTAAAAPFVLGNAASAADPGDGYARRVYSTTIRLNNPSGAREAP